MASADCQHAVAQPVRPEPRTPLGGAVRSVRSEQTGSGFEWKAQSRSNECVGHYNRESLAEATPENGDLIRWANRPENAPATEWWDSDDDPFSADQ